MSKHRSPADLTRLDKNELQKLFNKVSQELATTEHNSPEQHQAQASLQDIKRALTHHNTPRPKPPGC